MIKQFDITDVFQDLSSMGSIDLSFNSIKELQTNTFTDMYKLYAIDLSHNKIEVIHTGT